MSLEKIAEHIEHHLGPIDGKFEEVGGEGVRVCIHLVPPTDERPCFSLVTGGMSERPMDVPDGKEEYRFAELVMHLPADWPIGPGDVGKPENNWPMRWLQKLARLPHDHGLFLHWGDTVPNGDPPEPVAGNCGFCCMLLEWPLIGGPEFASLEVGPGKTVRFWGVIPLYREEMEFKLREGTMALEDRFDRLGVRDVIDLRRRNVAL